MEFKLSTESRKGEIVCEMKSAKDKIVYMFGAYVVGDSQIVVVVGDELPYMLSVNEHSIKSKEKLISFEIKSSSDETVGHLDRSKSSVSLDFEGQSYSFDKSFVRRIDDDFAIVKVKPSKFNNPLVKVYELKCQTPVYAFIASMIMLAMQASDVIFKNDK